MKLNTGEFWAIVFVICAVICAVAGNYVLSAVSLLFAAIWSIFVGDKYDGN